MSDASLANIFGADLTRSAQEILVIFLRFNGKSAPKEYSAGSGFAPKNIMFAAKVRYYHKI